MAAVANRLVVAAVPSDMAITAAMPTQRKPSE
jgi:hypothetical protein